MGFAMPEDAATMYGEPEVMYGEPEVMYGEPEVMYGEPEVMYGAAAHVRESTETLCAPAETMHGT